MSQSTQLPWRRRGPLDLLFHCEGRPGVILGSRKEQCIHGARLSAYGPICTVTDGGCHFTFVPGATTYTSWAGAYATFCCPDGINM